MASTYVNDLRLNEMATGDASGTWGTTTNTNLELIAEAFSYGTEAITTNADTHTTTIADGATDPGRSMFLKYTGTLDSTCTITIGPNTVSKLWIIENGTSGSQSIIIKQGTGGTVTIPSGKTKVIYSDGAGSGGAMVDAFATLNLQTSGIIETSSSIQTPLIEYTDGDDAITIADGGGVTFGSTIAASAALTSTSTIEGTTITATTAFVPDASDGAALGTSSLEFSDLFLADAAVINLGDDQDTTLTHVADTGILLNSTRQLQFGDSGTYIHQSADGVLDLVSDTELELNATTIDINGNADISGTLGVTGAVTADAGVSIDNITIDGTEIDLSSGTLTLDAQDEIHLDADSGIIRIRDDGADIGMLRNESTDFTVRSMVSDKDMLFKGNDGGSTITALTLDMSEAGTAIFNQDVGVGITPAHLGRTGSGHVVHLDGDDCQVRLQNSIVHHDNSGNTTLFIRNHYSATDSLARITLEAGTQLFTTGTGFTERARITAGGQLLIGSSFTSPVGGETVLQAAGNSLSGGVAAFYDPDVSVSTGNVILQLTFTVDQDATNGKFAQFSDGNHNIGSISAASGTSVAFNTTSDERLKKNIVDASSQLNVIKDVKVREFDWKQNNHHEVGMIAQELHKVIPNVVIEGSDEHKMNWGVDYGKLTPYLIKAVQELSETVDELKTEIQTLKGE